MIKDSLGFIAFLTVFSICVPLVILLGMLYFSAKYVIMKKLYLVGLEGPKKKGIGIIGLVF